MSEEHQPDQEHEQPQPEHREPDQEHEPVPEEAEPEAKEPETPQEKLQAISDQISHLALPHNGALGVLAAAVQDIIAVVAPPSASS